MSANVPLDTVCKTWPDPGQAQTTSTSNEDQHW